MRSHLVCLTTFAMAGCAGKGTGGGAESITAEAIRTHTTVLAHDSLEGRGTGQPGYQKAAQYVAARYKDLGLEPGGEAGGFFQTVPLRSTALVPTGLSVVLVRGQRTSPLVFEQDFVTEGSLRDTDIA